MSDKLRNLIVRTLSGAVLLAIVVAASFLGLKGFSSLLLVIIAIGVEEFYTLAKAKGANPQQILGIITSLSLFATSCHLGFRAMKPCESELVNTMLMVSALVALLGFALIFVAEVFRNKENPTLNIASTITGIVYVALPLSLMFYVPLLLAYMGGGALEWNPLIFLFYLFIVWGNDVFAYLVGITLGRHKMCERLSPKKSWEGFVGGVVGAMVMGAVGAVVVGGSLGVWLGLSVVVSLSSVVGDLVESMFKRDAGVKDSGNILPGHGGILDRFDALILSAPFAFIYLVVVVVVPNL